ncbi:HAD family hydrolase [Mucilaginibacter rubeus]|uniref:HAD family hydrolase n=1 Tax=Mucilaginibacter rubeus TaxID=2027860 RepID=A0AAE6MIA6_9SPHI|nr:MULTISPECIES: HAD family hydrolase [Mucilaginibacter]QEM04039.1 HAD family hydrolase [Mucilaginibacter rubeus]QEM16641.1 HAD family hydrolase [Mucilaginibacter gossypii]QTE46885.1 HAD family hydrolase [Mucilaginibacter rubeus]QTE53483.1 HAD family hydrolase [Mucilaginibacter rubeus]QTE58569.1 HAD family hydrolase [Mucilaginibacter rubeus]
MNLKVIAFDADDTLWVNEPYFQATEERFCSLLENFSPQHTISKELFKVEVDNLPLYGYGIKGYILSMIEAALSISEKNISVDVVETILQYGKDMLNQPIELLNEVEHVLSSLKDHYRLVVATKGDLLDQERKLKKSGLAHYFHHIEIMSDKKEDDYIKLIKHLDINPDEFMMIGNSLKSDVMPVINIGGHAVHVPYHTTWAHEHVETVLTHENFKHVHKISEVLEFVLESGSPKVGKSGS